MAVDSERRVAFVFSAFVLPTFFNTPGAQPDAQGSGGPSAPGRKTHSSRVMAAKMAYDVMASFTCPRTITFQDYRLGFTHKAIVVAILGYVCFNLFSGQLYLVDSVPLGLVSVWSTSDYNGTSGVSSSRGASRYAPSSAISVRLHPGIGAASRSAWRRTAPPPPRARAQTYTRLQAPISRARDRHGNEAQRAPYATRG